MSFFNSLQQYVANGVAGLGLSPRRFSMSRQDSNEGSPGSPSRSGSTCSAHSHIQGFPKVVPPPGTVPASCSASSQQGRRMTLNESAATMSPQHQIPQSRAGSFRRPRQASTAPPVERAPLAFCRRRLSWPEVQQQSTSGVQDTDGGFFEAFTALSWQRDNRRMSAIRAIEARSEAAPGANTGLEVNRNSDSYKLPAKERDQLYVEVLYTIANTVGAPAPGGQYAHYKEELYLQAQRAFGMSAEKHYRLLNVASEEKPPIVVLSVVVLEADGLEAKDANGFSDPYCMLGIQPVGGPPSPQPPLTPRTLSDSGSDHGPDTPPQQEKLRKHHSFRLSFKRKDGARREQRDSLGGPVPAKFIRATSVRPHTLSPKWNEKFRFDIDDVGSDSLHLDIWDHDDESCVLDAVTKLNEVRGVRGLGRFFKQVCQSARQGSQDDFLGCVNIPLQDIPSTGLEGWFRLEARSQRSTVQGRIRLKLWLSTREDRGTSEEDNWAEVRKQERLNVVFMSHAVSSWTSGPSWTWPGDIPGPALTILHQSAVQGDLTELQAALARWAAAVRLTLDTTLDPKFLHQLLSDLERLWNRPASNAGGSSLSRDEEQWLAEAFEGFLERSLLQLRQHRDVFPALHGPSLDRLESLLRCMSLLSTMRSFRQVCPFGKGVRGEVVTSLKRGAADWFGSSLREARRSRNPLVELSAALIADLQQGLTYYHALFDTTNGIQYFSIVYKQFDALLAEHVNGLLQAGPASLPGSNTSMNQWGSMLDGDREPPDLRLIELYLALQDFLFLRQHLSSAACDRPLALHRYHEWFEPDIRRWLILCKNKALQRIRASVQVDRICEGDRIVRHSTSAVDAASCFYQMREFWKLLSWPEPTQALALEMLILDAASSAALHYGDLIHQKLADQGYYDQPGPFKTTDEMCITVNDLEYVRRSLAELRPDPSEHPGTPMIESSLTQLEACALRVFSRIGPQMQNALQKVMFHLAWSPESLPTTQAIVPLLEYLDLHLSALNAALLPKNFGRALCTVWNAVLGSLSGQTDAGSDGDKPAVFHERLHEALDLLVDFFHAEGQGLSQEDLRNELYLRVEQRLQFHRTDTERLIDLFHCRRLADQLSAQLPGPYGVLGVRAYFNHDSLCVEVLHARDVIPLDPNGFSDPFVIIELLPRRVFAHCGEQHTNVHKKTLNPMFDECFEFSVTLEQCRSEGAMVAFTVMDHDVLTANDFAGEAFLALGNIPGVADGSSSVENFHGLKHVDLPLMHQHDKQNPILQILESRVGDRMAIEFVKKQKLRFSST